jgi:hypothetical protein
MKKNIVMMKKILDKPHGASYNKTIEINQSDI